MVLPNDCPIHIVKQVRCCTDHIDALINYTNKRWLTQDAQCLNKILYSDDTFMQLGMHMRGGKRGRGNRKCFWHCLSEVFTDDSRCFSLLSVSLSFYQLIHPLKNTHPPHLMSHTPRKKSSLYTYHIFHNISNGLIASKLRSHVT